MSIIKPKLTAVPTADQSLRAAITHRDSVTAEVNENREKVTLLDVLANDLAAAEAALDGVLRGDAAAMHAWALAGAKGPSPKADHQSREEASRKVAEAGAKLSASGIARNQFDAEYHVLVGLHAAAQQAVKEAERAVLGGEVLRSAREQKVIAKAYLISEYRHALVMQAARQLGGLDDYFLQADEITKPIMLEDEAGIREEAAAITASHLQALLTGAIAAKGD